MQFLNQLEKAKQLASRLDKLPLLNSIAPGRAQAPTKDELEGFSRCQNLALLGAKEIANLMQVGWTEKQTAQLLDTWLLDHGVEGFFHHSYVWFGDRTMFRNINRRLYWQFMPSERRILEGESFILDVAPVLSGFISDIGYSGCIGDQNPEFSQAHAFLKSLHEQIPRLFIDLKNGSQVWTKIDELIQNAGYLNIHKLYPFSVLGHRVYRVPKFFPEVSLLHFGWQSYWSILARGLFGQLLNADYHGNLTGMWAIEPHIGNRDQRFGAKFEEILVVESPDNVYWLSDSGREKKL